ncbi:polysaccharide Lyase Family 1 modular protein with two candidate pectate lyase domains [Eubacterium sp. CAG:38]|nr:polysaccharide Lyase Family 1 modular protein with two candidate pectate lyase domains [Eubacterium sp. CAG:38]
MKMKTNRKVKKLFSYVLTAAMVITAVTPAFAGKVKAVAAGLTLTEQSGWLESAYVEWQPVKNAEGYVAYVKEASASDDAYEKLDDTLIRQYADYWRADALGLKEGSYVMKVTAVLKDGKTVSESTSSLEVEKYDRSGFAFSENSKFQTGSGAYNDDGTLKKNAQVIYVTPETAKTCTAVVNGKEVTGFQSILDAKQSAGTKDTSPLDFRIVGCVTADDVDHFSSSAEGIQLKGKSAYTEMNITIEGVGEDAAVQGFGFLVRNSGNVEFRNFAVMAFMDDGISLDTKNCNIWVHNMDIFYGSTGGDSDQAKGDGSVDIKGASTNVTVSYVHFWDSGKCSLCGMSDSAEFLVTYHHNWFDHSDSRHPRIRVASVHIYNNYFDGNAKYGVGTTKGSSAFVEANYYRNCKNPMMSSMQGTDALGQGTFSGENGGMIKAYNNITVGASSLIYANSDAGTAKADAVSFDAYLASSREETVPSSYKTVAGATTYNNFDTSSAYDLGVAEEDIDDPQDVPSIVTKYAGRMNGGDFDWTFQESDDTNYSVDTALKAKVVNYKSSVLAIGGYKGVDVEPSTTEKATESTTEATTKATESTTKATEATTKATESTTKATEATTKATESTTEATTEAPTTAPAETTAKVHNFSTDGTSSDFYMISGKLSSNKGTVSYNGLSLDTCLKIESKTKITFTTTDKAELVLVFNQKNSSDIKVDGTVYTLADGILSLEIEAGSHEITKESTGNLYYMSVSQQSETPTTPVTPTEPTQPEQPTTPSEPETPITPSEPEQTKCDLYVSPSGKSTAAGTQNAPMDLLTAINSISAGYTIWMEEGTYKAYELYGAPIVIAESNSGAEGAYKTISSINGGTVTIDFSGMAELGSNRGIVLDGSYWHFYDIDICNAGDNGMLLSGDNNIIELCQFYANHDSGLQISRYNTSADTIDLWPSNNLILNCTAFDNKDEATCENADGFAAKLTCGEGNVFDGCISYCNSDDGWDLYAKPATGSTGVVTIKNSVAFGNGKLTNGEGSANGDMNGFKLGGSNKQCPTPHVVTNCIAFNNGATGFTDNGNGGAVTLTNCTSVNNGMYNAAKANYMCYRTSKDAAYTNLLSFAEKKTTATDQFLGTVSHTLYHYKGVGTYWVNNWLCTDGAKTKYSGSEGADYTVSASDFVSTQIPGYDAATGAYTADYHSIFRNADGSINLSGLYEVSSDSPLYTAGTQNTALGASFSK